MRFAAPLAVTAVLAAGLLAATDATGPAGAADAPYSVQTLHFAVHTGPDGGTACDIVGDLYLHAGADAAHRVPAILTTNGFGGSKDDQAGIGQGFGTRGYAVLSYSGLGFGGSGCKITLDDPDYDGQAASQLISYLGGHRFAPRHAIRLVVAGGSGNYRGGVTPMPVTIAGGTGQTLTLPAVG